ncbi:MAG: GtrA family protein [Sphingomonadales bacterium]|nr:GtrA family protein [Sphingomonadales bacterium]
MMARQFARFLIVGLANTFAGLAIIYAAKYFAGAGDVVANAIGYGVGLAVSFVLNKSWTFAHSGDNIRTVGRFLSAFAVCYLLNLATVLGLISLANVDPYIAQALGIPPYTVSFFLFSRYWIFKKSSSNTKPAGEKNSSLA